MAAENQEVVLESFRRFDPDDLEGWSRFWHPECTATAADSWPEQRPFIGREAVVRQFERLFADWSEHRFEDVETAAAVENWTIVTWRLVARGAASGLPVEMPLAAALRIRGGQIVEAHFRWTRDQALEAAGLPA